MTPAAPEGEGVAGPTAEAQALAVACTRSEKRKA